MVKLFKAESGSDRVIRLVSLIDKNPSWYGISSKWSLLEVARALRKDGKTKEIVELDLRELRSHKIGFVSVSDRIISEAEKIIGTSDLYSADAVHISTYRRLAQRSRLEGFLCEDVHYNRFKEEVPVRTIADLEFLPGVGQ